MTELSAERELTRAETAAYLHEFADKLAESSTHDRHTDQRDGEDDLLTGGHGEDRSGDGYTDVDTSGDDGRVTFVVGNDSATINPPNAVQFAVEIDSDSSLMGDEKAQSVEFDLSWSADDVEESDEFLID